MKALILAAGMGNRIKEITGGKPKGFLEINGKTIIQHQIDVLKAAGITKIAMVTGYKKELFQVFKKQGIELLYNPFYRGTNVMGSYWFAKDFLDEPFVYLHGDTYFEPEILDLLIASPGNNLAVEFKDCGKEEMKVKVEQGEIIEISKEMTESAGEFIGIGKFDDFPEINSKMEALIDEYYGSFFERVITGLLGSHIKFKAINIGDRIWEEVDFKEDYENLKKRVAKKFATA
jgi:choline kinase